ncbi:hypothetical protein [Paenibacillus lautus]|uniref:hypothetical protein n=1 Tax=Paenibacillus lautus TaxID=1401 RepID=UPI001C7D95DF|nr:hypothetical protein [Paenibacillus lautus]MBX4150611.1 hypothetical protein [Paenibacillus lautus]
MNNGIFYEDNAAKGLGKPTRRIENIAEAAATRANKNGDPNIPTQDQIKDIRTFIFRLDGRDGIVVFIGEYDAQTHLHLNVFFIFYKYGCNSSLFTFFCAIFTLGEYYLNISGLL